MVTYVNSTSQNPFTLTAPQAGIYKVNAGQDNPLLWDSVTVYLLPPTAPNNLSAIVNLSVPSVQLSWTDNSSNETGFIIEREILNSGSFEIVDTVGTNVSTYVDTTVELLSYRYRVKSFNVYGHSTYSNLSEAQLPVELVSFEAVNSGNDVLLSWHTSTELNNLGFEIEKAESIEGEIYNDWKLIKFIKGNGTTCKQHSYFFSDENLLPGQYKYRLKQIDFDGTFEYSKVVEVSISGLNEFFLSQNYPNPFNPTTKIKYTVTDAYYTSPAWVTLKVFDILGNEVTTLVNEYKSAGSYEVGFNAAALTSGVYYYQLKVGNLPDGEAGFSETKKMILLK
ncbi:MAG: T9SS type A sorting domain-containing protein [Ignavibacteriales bacterium]|nr:MAG: T9SS type A sorting domain-containing protein [Ignavibacteriales bacterium]